MNLEPYQNDGVAFLKERRFALLGDEMGLGKSAQAIRAAYAAGCQRILVLCPAVARWNWANEFQKWTPREIPAPRPVPIVSRADVLDLAHFSSPTIVTYSIASDEKVSAKLATVLWDVLILDEAHYLKNREAKRTKMIFSRIARMAKRVWCLTGTPAPNNMAELYPMMAAFGRWPGNYWSFLNTFCQTIETPYGIKIVGAKNIPKLKNMLDPVLLRRVGKDVFPDRDRPRQYAVPVEADKDFSFDPIESMEAEVLHRELISDEDPDEFLRAKGHQFKSVRQKLGLQKVGPAVEIISDELKDGAYKKVVVFAWHRRVLEMLYDELKDYDPVLVYGSTSPMDREFAVDQFQNNPDVKIFIGQIEAAGTAINLTAAHNVIFVEADWTPARNVQAMYRVQRIGQTNPVLVRFLTVANSVDQDVARTLDKKIRSLSEVFDCGMESIVLQSSEPKEPPK